MHGCPLPRLGSVSIRSGQFQDTIVDWRRHVRTRHNDTKHDRLIKKREQGTT